MFKYIQISLDILYNYIINCLSMNWILKPSSSIFAFCSLEIFANKGSFFITVFKSKDFMLLNELLMFVAHSLVKQKRSFVSTTRSSFSRYSKTCTYRCKSPIFICFSIMYPEQKLAAPFFLNDIYQICSKLNFECSFNFWGNLLLLVHWVTAYSKWSGSKSLYSLKDSQLVSIWANTLFVFSILYTDINNHTRQLHVFFAAVLNVHGKVMAISAV